MLVIGNKMLLNLDRKKKNLAGVTLPQNHTSGNFLIPTSNFLVGLSTNSFLRGHKRDQEYPLLKYNKEMIYEK